HGDPFYRRNWCLHATTLGGVPHDLCDRDANSNRSSSSLASSGFGGRAHSGGQLFHRLVLVSGAQARQGASARCPAALTRGKPLGFRRCACGHAHNKRQRRFSFALRRACLAMKTPKIDDKLRLLTDFGETDAICVEVLRNPATEEGILLKVMARGPFEQG